MQSKFLLGGVKKPDLPLSEGLEAFWSLSRYRLLGKQV